MEQKKITSFFSPIEKRKSQEDEDETTEEEGTTTTSTTSTTEVEKPMKRVIKKRAPAKKGKEEEEEENDEEEEVEDEKPKKKSTKSTSAPSNTTAKPRGRPKKTAASAEPAPDDASTEESKSSGGYYDDMLNSLTDESWKQALQGEFTKPYWKTLIQNLNATNHNIVFPPKEEIFTALNWTPLSEVKVVIVGQDPYHGAGQAHGLSFSVKKGVNPPPSLKNIYKDLANDIPGFVVPKHGFLEKWAHQGVLMLNAVLTVEKAQPNSHKKFGWAEFTDAILNILNKQSRPIVFVLWGEFAKKKAKMVDTTKHHIVSCGHPSPYSVSQFMGFHSFSLTNQHLKSDGLKEIDWTLPQTL